MNEFKLKQKIDDLKKGSQSEINPIFWAKEELLMSAQLLIFSYLGLKYNSKFEIRQHEIKN